MSRSFVVLILEALTVSLILFQCASAAEYQVVGGATGWVVGSNMENWTTTTIFYPGDNLVFVYGPARGVLEVNKDAFDTCQRNSPIATYNDGHTVIPLDNPGTRYFICGSSGHCESGHKVQIVVQFPSLRMSKLPPTPRRTPTPRRPPTPRRTPTPRRPPTPWRLPTPRPPPTPRRPLSPPPPPLGPTSPHSSASKSSFHHFMITVGLIGPLVIMVI